MARLLVVEDDEATRELLAGALTQAGYDVAVAAEGVSAMLEISASGEVDLMVLDLDMPHMNGWEVLDELWEEERFAAVPVVVVTGHRDACVPQASALLTKPVDLGALVHAIDEELAGKTDVGPIPSVPRPKAAVLLLTATVSALTVAFLGAVGYGIGLARASGKHANQLAQNAVPSAEVLTAARSSLRHIDGLLDDAVLGAEEGRFEGLGETRQRAADARSELAKHTESYVDLPRYGGEEVLEDSLRATETRLDSVLREVLDALDQRDVRRAESLENGEWRTASDEVDNALRRAIVFNVKHAAEHAEGVEEAWRKASVGASGFAGLAVVLAIAGTWVAAAAVRRQLDSERARSAELEMFGARVAHDLISPMNAAGLALQTVQRRGGDLERLGEAGYHSIQRARTIVDALLDFARSGGQPVPSVPADVEPTLAAVVEQLQPEAQRARVALRKGPCPEARVACASGILAILLDNLARNAIKYMGDSAERQVELRVGRKGDQLLFEVEDTGPGLPAGFAQMAFEPYRRGANAVGQQGLGLGLATVRRLVLAHGGELGVRHGAERGAIFWFSLPAAA